MSSACMTRNSELSRTLCATRHVPAEPSCTRKRTQGSFLSAARHAIFPCVAGTVSLASSVLFTGTAAAVEASPAHCPPQEVAQVAGFLGIGEQEKDPVDPFTLQGVTEKQYSIQELEGTKVVKRRPGVSVQTCIKVASTAQTGGTNRLDAPEETTCRSAEDRSDVKKACRVSCKTACTDGLEEYRTTRGAELGFPPSKEALERPTRKCARNCAYECQKEGSGYRFTVNYGG